MGYVNKGGVDLLAKQDDLSSHLITELRVQIGQRLIHKEHLTVANHGAADGHTLSLTAGQSTGLTGQIVGDAKNLCRLGYTLVHLILRHLFQAQAERHVLEYGEVGIQSVVLEYHSDIAVTGLQIVDHYAVNLDGTVGDILQTCDHTEGGGFTASGRTDENDEFLIGNVQIEVIHRNHVFAVYFLYIC